MFLLRDFLSHRDFFFFFIRLSTAHRRGGRQITNARKQRGNERTTKTRRKEKKKTKKKEDKDDDKDFVKRIIKGGESVARARPERRERGRGR